MKNKRYMVLIGLIVGIVSFLLALSMEFLFPEWVQRIGSLQYTIVGLGAGLAGACASKLLTHSLYKRNPELSKQAKINETIF